MKWLFFLLLIAEHSLAQKNQNELVRFSREQGMPSNEAYCVFKDSKGFIWISTDEGVVRMRADGKDVIDTLPDNTIFKIREDRSGRIWFFSYSHKWCYFENEKLHVYPHNNAISNALQSSILLDVWIKDDQTFVINTTHQKNFTVNIPTGKVSSNTYFREGVFQEIWEMNVYQNNYGSVFAQHKQTAGSRLGGLLINVLSETINQQFLFKFPVKGRYQFYGAVRNQQMLYVFADNMLFQLNKNGSSYSKTFDHEILSMVYDSTHSEIIIGFRTGGIAKLSENNLEITEQYEALLNKSISSIVIDDDGGEWFSTLEDGVFYNKRPDLNQISTTTTQRLSTFKKNSLLYADVNGLYLLKDSKSTKIASEKVNYVYDIDVINNQEILISGNYTFSYLNGKTLQKNSVVFIDDSFINIKYLASTSSIAYKKGASYFTRVSLDLLKFALQPDGTFLPEEIIIQGATERGSVYLDSSFTLWMMGRNNLYQYDSSLQTFKPHTFASNLFLDGVSSMAELNANTKIFSIRSNGIAIFKEGVLVAHLKQSDGLLSNSVKNLLVKNNKIWVVASNGVSIIEIKSIQPFKFFITNLSENIGLNNKVIYQVLPIDDKLYLACSEGLFELNNLNKYYDRVQQPIPFYINKIILNNRDTNFVNQLHIPYSNSRISIHFNAVNYNSSNSIRYHYRIVNQSETWFELNSNQLELQNLAAGVYEVELLASIPDQKRYSATQRIKFIVDKPWWKTNLFYGSILLSFFGISYLIFKKRITTIEESNYEKTRIKTEMMNLEQTALRSQMNPHFIFNSLSSIQELVVSGNKDEANDYLVKFAKLIRKTLELSQQPFLSIADEKEYITEYVAMEKMRLDKTFDFSFEIDPSLDANKIAIPNMMLQPIVENSIRHGIKQLKSRRGVLTVKIKKEGNYVHCSIIDNGVGIEPKKSNDSQYHQHKSFGLDIVEKRLMGLPNYYVGNYFIKVENLQDEQKQRVGTLVEIHLPLMYTHHD